MTLRRALTLVVLLALPGCRSGAQDRGEGPSILPRDPDKPYVVTAIDYHFHDAHPTPRLDAARELVFSNVGSNLHNVTIPEIAFSRDIQPGERVNLGPVGELLPEPGRHRFYCVYHRDRDMTGVVVVRA